ncbi:MAG: NAD(+) diphosphatase [Actinobacteria bacterium]|nr:NAD(+) diphosphatase [Actinomycetota bacterium]MBI3688586.1 NAD(+) diphosphatase [Actinomycetota bacterium]
MRLREVPALSRSEHDRSAHRRTDEGWLAEAWQRARVLVIAEEGTTAVTDTGTGPRLAYRSPDAEGPAGLRLFLGERDGTPYFATLPGSGGATLPGAVPGGERWLGLPAVAADLDDFDAGLLVTATALAGWHARHPRCARCGAVTEVIHAGWTRRCPDDGSEHWPRTDPAVIMLVHDGADNCVLGRGKSWPEGRYSILAGFVEPGESLEGAVAREVAEEVGLRVTDIAYLGSQPWPFPASLMLGFIARVDGDPTLRVSGDELAEARWFSRAEIRAGAVRLAPSVSIAFRIITDWLDAG